MFVEAASAETRTIWLSGAILTFLSKVVMPVLWFAFLIGVPIWVYLSVGRFSIRPDFQFIAWFAVIAAIPLTWVTIHLQLVGYRGRELVIGNCWREGSVPFEAVQAVEPVCQDNAQYGCAQHARIKGLNFKAGKAPVSPAGFQA